MAVSVLSFGGGVQTTALAVMWRRGEIDADYCVFADTGGETPETYQHIAAVGAYLGEHQRIIHIVRHPQIALEEWVLSKSTVIPVITDSGLGHRQCTHNWKIQPIKRYARERGAKKLQLILGISVDEAHRMKPDRAKWVEREFPLVERRLTRADCRNIALEAGLPDPPKSACFFCPLQNMARWRVLAAAHPALFRRAEALEEAINARRQEGAAFLTGTRVPLSRAASVEQPFLTGLEAGECEGVCFV